MSAQSIRAGSAFVEVSIRDKTKAGLDAAQARIKAAANAIRAQQSLERDLKLINGPTAQERLLSFAHVLKSMAQPLQKLAMDFGVLGAAILGPLGAAAGTFARLGKELGSTDARNLTGAWNALSATFQAISFVVGQSLAPALIDIAKVLISAGLAVGRFIQQNQGLVLLAAAVGAAFVSFAAVLGAAALGLQAIAAVAALLAAPLTGTIAIIGALTVAATLFAGVAILTANNWQQSQAVITTVFQSIEVAAMSMASTMLSGVQKAIEAIGLLASTMKVMLGVMQMSGLSIGEGMTSQIQKAIEELNKLAASVGVAKSAIDQAQKEKAGESLGAGVGLAAGIKAKINAGLSGINVGDFVSAGFGVSVTKSASGVGRVGPSSIQRVSDKESIDYLKKILTAIEKGDAQAQLEFS